MFLFGKILHTFLRYARLYLAIQFFDPDSLLPPPFTFLTLIMYLVGSNFHSYHPHKDCPHHHPHKHCCHCHCRDKVSKCKKGASRRQVALPQPSVPPNNRYLLTLFWTFYAIVPFLLYPWTSR